MSSSLLYDLATDLLLASEAAIDPLCTGHELPPRRYVHFGEPAWDLCTDNEVIASSGQLVTWWSDVQTEVSTVGRTCAVRFLAKFCVELTRCFPDLGEDSQPLAPEVYEAASEILDVDSWALLRGVTAWVAGLDCSWRQIEDVFPSGPSGGMAGVRICVRVELNDPDPLCTAP